MLVRCLYASRAAKPQEDAVLDAILKQSRKNNAKYGITGMLCFANGVFVQVIEGGRAEVSRLLNAIIRDDRNIDVEVLSFEEITERRFGNWNMGQINIAAINPALLLKYSEKPELNPFACNAHVTMALLGEIAETGTIVHRSS
jgi:Sensors of blue-light using FAD